jgi:hypothetical protein
MMGARQVFEAMGNCDLDELDKLLAEDPGLIQRRYDWGWSLAHFAAATGMFEVLEWIADYDKEALAAINDNGLVCVCVCVCVCVFVCVCCALLPCCITTLPSLVHLLCPPPRPDQPQDAQLVSSLQQLRLCSSLPSLAPSLAGCLSHCITSLLSRLSPLTARLVVVLSRHEQTPMHYAAANGQTDALHTLVLESRKSTTMKCKQGNRPVDVARKGRCRALLKVPSLCLLSAPWPPLYPLRPPSLPPLNARFFACVWVGDCW